MTPFPVHAPSEKHAAEAEAGVFVDLKSLIKLEFRAKGFTFLPHQPVRSLLAGKHGSRLRGRGLNFDELRHYLPGDDVRTMDWRATARLREPQVRVYTEERDRPCLLLIDQRLSMFFGSGRAMKSVAAANAAALAAWRVFHSQDRIGAIVFNDDTCVEIAPRRSRRTVLQILNAIVRQNGAFNVESPVPVNPGMLHEVLKRAGRLAPHDTLVVLISDGFGAGSESVHQANQISAHNDLLCVFVFDPLETAFPAIGPVLCSDGNQQLEVDMSIPAWQRGYAAQFTERLSKLQTLTRRKRMPLMTLSTAEEIGPQLRKQLGGHPGPAHIKHVDQ